MADLPPGAAELVSEVERITALPGDATDRVPELLTVLHRLVPYAGSVMQVLNPERREFEMLGEFGYGEPTLAYLRSSEYYHEMELLGMDRDRPPMCLRDAPVPPAELASWAEHLEPAGFREGVGITLFTPDGRHLGLLSLHTDDPAYPSDAARDFLGMLTPLIADAVDPMRSLVTLSRIVADAQAGVVLTRAGNVLSIPGLPGHPLLAIGSAVLEVAAASLTEGSGYHSFLCPHRPAGGTEGHVRITVLPCPTSTPIHLLAMVLTSPAGDLRGLTRRELEILGLLVDGWSNQRIASRLVIAQRTVAAHVEHILSKLNAPSRTLAAVRALRRGLYVPRLLARSDR
ncbi:response regulator transcription factor [Plantactinospora sp. S1510]|uniref:Response regulator transcription factor n=1 Tax=Plantactinospora alkalitolerans TaxID=2789879 RepID=A0ABS0H8G1_9ACTN|nr:LuxR C-terminal-related transcriptional regulator [Plantactinospora alkalitolerans]MBF9134581.1 response regulator transcription factor [Plantactinospora alkalitolerans]